MSEHLDANQGEASPAAAAAAARWDWDALDRELRPRFIRAGTHCFQLTRQEAEDAVQTVFLKCLDLAPRIRDPIGYLKTSFRHTCINVLRARQRGERATLPDDVEDDSALQAVVRWESRQALRRAFASADVTCRKLIRRHFLSAPSSLAESAKEIGYSVTSVWRKIQMCLKRMRSCMG